MGLILNYSTYFEVYKIVVWTVDIPITFFPQRPGATASLTLSNAFLKIEVT